ncbi:MAG: hypothetical protein M1821_004736 [Bathelium mastoideum]|nr:MAG: hypothetical protein M1821_004736 [Bathelium mastoideum]
MPQVNALRAAMDEMSRWLEGNQSVFCSRQIYFDNLHSSIKACCLVIEEIEAHLQKVHQCPDFKNKCKFLWKDEQIKEWQKLLDSQVSAFSLHLAVLRLNSPLEQQSLLDSPSAKDILDKARDDATSFTQRRRSHSGDAGSSSKSGMMRSRNKRFIFDGELLRSKPYRKVTEALHRRGSPVDDLSSSDGQKSSDAADMAVGTRGQVVGSSHASAIGDIHETESIHESLKSQVEGHHEASQNGLMSHDLQPTGRNDCLDYIPQPAAFHESNTRSVSNEHISSETNPLSRFNTTGTSDLQDENYTPLTSVDQCTEPLPNSGLATVYERPKAKLLVEVEIEDVGKEHLGLEDFGNDLLNDVYNVIGTLRNRLLQRAELEPPELVLVRQCLLAKSADGAHSVALTKLFLLGVIDEVGKGNYWDPTVSIKYAVDRPHPNVLALQSVVCKELNESAIQMEAGPLIPHDRLQSTLSIERVSALVSDDGVLSILNMNQVATIHEQGLKILAALILAETNLINVIRTNGTAFFVDSRLPLSLDHGSQGCLDPVAHHTVCQIQWHVMPALVQTRRDGQGAWPKYDKAQILPFISQTWIASGGFGAVYEVQLHKVKAFS